MIIVATLGDLTISVLRNDFEQFNFNSNYGYASHPKLEGKPRLQAIGDGLSIIRFSFIFHKELYDPELGILQLRTLAKRKESLPLVFGEIYKGRWVITDIEETPIKVSVKEEETILMALGARVELLEDKEIPDTSRATNSQVFVNPFQFLA